MNGLSESFTKMKDASINTTFQHKLRSAGYEVDNLTSSYYNSGRQKDSCNVTCNRTNSLPNRPTLCLC